MSRFASSGHARIVAVITPEGGLRGITSAALGAGTGGRAPMPRPNLVDALTSCLAMLEEDPERFQRAAVVWHARWCTLIPALTLAEAHAALAALEALPGRHAGDGAQTLRALCDRHGLPEVAAVLDAWAVRRETIGVLPWPRTAQSASNTPMTTEHPRKTKSSA
jgi:hypothetical protein